MPKKKASRKVYKPSLDFVGTTHNDLKVISIGRLNPHGIREFRVRDLITNRLHYMSKNKILDTNYRRNTDDNGVNKHDPTPRKTTTKAHYRRALTTYQGSPEHIAHLANLAYTSVLLSLRSKGRPNAISFWEQKYSIDLSPAFLLDKSIRVSLVDCPALR